VVELVGPRGRMATYTIYPEHPPADLEADLGCGERFVFRAWTQSNPPSVRRDDPALDVEVVLPVERCMRIDDTRKGFIFPMDPEDRAPRVFGWLEPRLADAPYFLQIVHADDDPFPIVTTLAAARLPSPQFSVQADGEIKLEALHEGRRYALRASFARDERVQ